MAKGRTGKSKVPHTALQDITEADQWRLVKETGILEKVESSDDSPDTPDEVFNAIILIIPFSFLYLMMDILVNQQYGKHPSAREYAGRLVSAIPVLSAFIFYSAQTTIHLTLLSSQARGVDVANSRKQKPSTQVGLFVVSIAAGTRLIWLVNRAPWLVTIRQGPPLATIWIYTVAALNLLPAVIGLALVAAWFWYSDMKLFF